jgi:hypothetical protein
LIFSFNDVDDEDVVASEFNAPALIGDFKSKRLAHFYSTAHRSMARFNHGSTSHFLSSEVTSSAGGTLVRE